MTATVQIVGLHPYADKFPMLGDDELDELANSIATVGLLHPIVVNPGGLILDGRNRLEACNRAEVEADVEVYEGDDIAEYVIACNVRRRDMSTGRRAMATALVLQADGRRENGRWRRGSVDIHGSVNSDRAWQQRLNECGIILDYKPDLADDVVSGAIALNAAFKQADEKKKEAKEEPSATPSQPPPRAWTASRPRRRRRSR